ncbi:MAM and LDL-receptor class A domain-containing protein 1-like isoform X2 [Anneissia japonica]|uniref:MAM and LDL-receptor class A domain-containing protein 1-like isoform X2 n=1 Tax=Anneissia japonica TaxID=1529436 RepID=UPI001425AB6C|nr:MAM and LDL-receptor class A domain-containing protein 1-like isoform X2 [Anneissia japonica]
MPKTGNFELVFEASRGSGNLGDIAIDDVRVYDAPCASNTIQPTADPTEYQKADCNFEQGICNYVQELESDFYWRRMKGPTPSWNTGPDFDHTYGNEFVILLPVTNISMNCDFEGKLNASMCGFTQSKSDDFDWQLRKGSTDSTGTGPSADHTYGNTKGQYLYVEASSPRRPNERARVVSPLVESANHLLCLKFWYHMKGEHVGKLILYRRLDGTGTSKQLWMMDGDQGDRWIEAWLPINKNDDTDEFIETLIQLIFEGVIGDGHLGDIAIDDIKLESHYCFQSETKDNPTVTLLSCDFETGITQCGFSQDLSDVLDWKLSNISEGQPDIPNYSEISARQKSFAYITMAGRKKGDKANLATSTTTSNGTQRCLSFKYIKVGDVQQQLNIYSLDKKDALRLIGTVPYKETKNGWESCQFKLPVDQGMSKIMFEGVVGFGQVGYIALDDVIINTGACTGKISPDNDVPLPKAVVQAGDDGLDVVSKLFISFTVILLCLILVSGGILATRHKYTKRVMQREHTENQASYHYAKDPDISSDVAVSNPVYDIARLSDSA